MQSVLISIKPKWCELIANGEKTIEIRKTRPKIETPFKCYIYCTKGKHMFYKSIYNNKFVSYKPKYYNETEEHLSKNGNTILSGKVIGEFICNGIIRNCEMANADIAEQQGKIKREDLLKYSNGKELFGWHISELVIYDNPKELNELIKECCSYFDIATKNCTYLGVCAYQYREQRNFNNLYKPQMEIVCADSEMCINRVTRPPQSWCYVESL